MLVNYNVFGLIGGAPPSSPPLRGYTVTTITLGCYRYPIGCTVTMAARHCSVSQHACAGYVYEVSPAVIGKGCACVCVDVCACVHVYIGVYVCVCMCIFVCMRLYAFRRCTTMVVYTHICNLFILYIFPM